MKFVGCEEAKKNDARISVKNTGGFLLRLRRGRVTSTTTFALFVTSGPPTCADVDRSAMAKVNASPWYGLRCSMNIGIIRVCDGAKTDSLFSDSDKS